MQANVYKKQLSLEWMVVISIFVFIGGALGGILFCGHYAHDPLAPVSGSAAEPSFQDQIERFEQETRNNPSETEVLRDREEAIKVLEKIIEIKPSAMVWSDQSVQKLVRAYRTWKSLNAEQPL